MVYQQVSLPQAHGQVNVRLFKTFHMCGFDKSMT